MSASETERRDEERRRKEREDDVRIGRTSAKPGARDYAIDPQVTERELVDAALESDDEREIWRRTEEGMRAFRLLNIEDAQEAFARVEELKPNAYLYHHGIVLFYLGRARDAARVFARNAASFESRFRGEPATEERLWRDACEIAARRSASVGGVLPPALAVAPAPDDDDDDGPREERRRPLRLARDLFARETEGDACGALLAVARLRALCGAGIRARDVKLWRFHSWYFLGLYHDVKGRVDESKACMKMSLRQNVGSMNGDDITKCLPVLHMSRRDWYDDDDFEYEGEGEGEGENEGDTSTSNNNDDTDDRVRILVEWNPERLLRAGVNDMKVADLQDSLERRGLKTTGSKADLRERMFDFVMNEAMHGEDRFISTSIDPQ